MVKILLDNRDECEVVKALESMNEDTFRNESGRTSELFKLIEEQHWRAVTNRLREHPEEASVWSFPDGYHGEESQRRLPIHEACRHCPPKDVITSLIDAFPGGVKSKDYNGRMPMHHACIWGASSDVVRLLLRAFPGSKDAEDRWGNTPVDALQATDTPDSAVTDILVGDKKQKNQELQKEEPVRVSSRDIGWRYRNHHPEMLTTRSIKTKSPRELPSGKNVQPLSTKSRSFHPPSTKSRSFFPDLKSPSPAAERIASALSTNADDGVENDIMQQFVALWNEADAVKSKYEAKEKAHNREREVMKAKCELMEEEIALAEELKEKVSTLEMSAAKYENVIAERNKYIAELKEKLSNEKLSRLENTQSLQKDNAEMEDELNELRLKYEVTNKEVIELKEAHTKSQLVMHSAEDEKAQLKEQIYVLEAAKSSLETRLETKIEAKVKIINELQEKLNATEELNDNEKKNLISKHKEEKQKLFQEFENWKASFEEEKGEMAAQHEKEKEERAQDNEMQKIAFEEEKEKLKAEYDQAILQVTQERDSLKASVREADDNLKSSVEIISQLKNVLSQKESPLVAKVKTLRDEITCLKDDREQLVNILSEKEDEVFRLKQDVEGKQTLLDEVDALKRTVSMQEKELELKKEELNTKEQNEEQCQQGKQALEELLKEKEREVEELGDQLVDLENAKNVEIDSYRCLNEGLKSKLAALDEKAQKEKTELVARYYDEIDNLKQEMGKGVDSSAVDALQSKIDVLERKVEWMEPRLTDTSKTIYEMKTFAEETPARFSTESPPSATIVAPKARKPSSPPQSVPSVSTSKQESTMMHNATEEGDASLESRFLQWLDDHK